MADWPEHAIWWQLHPLTFTGATPEPAHRLGRIEAWLDYLVDLGGNGLLLGPVFASQTHGYDTVDHFRIDPRLGTDEDFDHLVGPVPGARRPAAPGRGVQPRRPGVRRVPGRAGARPVVGRTRPGSGSTSTPADPTASVTPTSRDTTNWSRSTTPSPRSQDYVARVMTHWLDRGRVRLAAGRGLRRATAVLAGGHGPGPDRPPRCLAGGRADPRRLRRPPSRDGGLDSVTQYELWKAIWSSLNDQQLLRAGLGAGPGTTPIAAAFLPQTFVGNHDVTRLASRLTDAASTCAHALAVLFTVAGAPSVYAGDEQAFRGVKYDRAGGDDEIRPAFPDSPG